MKIHLVKTRYANAYVVSYDETAFVIDVASGSQRYVLGFVEETLHRPVDTITLVACTHDDRDHMGGIEDLARLCDATLATPYASGDAIHKLMNDPFGGMIRATTGFREALRARNRGMYINPERDAAARLNPHYEGSPVNKTPRPPQRALRLKDKDRLPGLRIGKYSILRAIHGTAVVISTRKPAVLYPGIHYSGAASRNVLSSRLFMPTASILPEPLRC